MCSGCEYRASTSLPLTWGLVVVEARRSARSAAASADGEHVDQPPVELDPTLVRALRGLSQLDREALLLVAWEDLTPGQVAKALGISPVAFRVRLLRARRRFRASLEQAQAAPPAPHLNHLDVEGT